MSIPNRRDEPTDPSEPDAAEEARRGNPASVYDERVPSTIETATARAATVSHRFGGVRYALTRRDQVVNAEKPDAEEAPGEDEQEKD